MNSGPRATGITLTFAALTPSLVTIERLEYSESATIAAARPAYRRAIAVMVAS